MNISEIGRPSRKPAYETPSVEKGFFCESQLLCNSSDQFGTSPLDGEDYGNY